MNKLSAAAWLLAAAISAWLLWQKAHAPPVGDCQHYDSLGRGIGCEGPDFADDL
jgi:hypothetical protein